MESIWDWKILEGCFSGKIAPTDIDGMVEKNGHFLVIETKRPNVEIPLGQLYTFQAMQKLGCFTVIIVWGHKDKPEAMQVLTENGDTSKIKQIDLDGLRRYVERWYCMAIKDIRR